MRFLFHYIPILANIKQAFLNIAAAKEQIIVAKENRDHTKVISNFYDMIKMCLIMINNMNIITIYECLL